MKAKQGTLLMVDRGEYSDYSVTGFFVVLQEFEPMQKLAEYLGAHPEQMHGNRFEANEFLSFLLGQGLLLEIEHGNLYLSDYGQADGVRFTPMLGEKE